MRTLVKRVLALGAGTGDPEGMTTLIYHRVGGGSPDERDITTDRFREQVDVLAQVGVASLDEAATRLQGRSHNGATVVTFDDGFADVYDNAWPLLRERSIPFTVYLCSSFVGGTMHWDGSTAKAAGPALSWRQLSEMVDSGLCTIGNHTYTHPRPERLSTDELDLCGADIEHHLGILPAHFAFCWGIDVPAMKQDLAARFRTAATGTVGRAVPGSDLLAMPRVPVRRSDPIEFFRAKLTGRLRPEKLYGHLVDAAKTVGARA